MDRGKLTSIHDHLERIVDWVDRAEVILTFSCMVAIVTMGAMEIFSRYVLDKSLFFVYELTILLANWMYFLGFSLVFKRNRDIEIEFFVKRLPLRVRKTFSIVTSGAIFYFLMILAYYTFKLLVIQSRHSTEGLGIPNHYFSLPIFIGTLSILLICLNKFLAVGLHREEG